MMNFFVKINNRFVLTQFAVSGSHQSVCFAVSTSPDPTGTYYRYEVVTPRFIRSTVVPEKSDFKYAMSEWTWCLLRQPPICIPMDAKLEKPHRM